MTQRERILRMLREAGDRGVHSFALYQAHLPRAAARIRELRASGYNITSEKAGKGCRYKLIEVSTAPSSDGVRGANLGERRSNDPARPSTDSGQLFEPEPERPVSAITGKRAA